MSTDHTIKSDVVIIGSGASGLSAALHCAAWGRVTLISKSGLISGATRWAQGGIAAAFSDQDSAKLHASDTESVGGHLCYSPVVEAITDQAADAVDWLLAMGVPLNQVDGKYVLGREGGHGHRRIVHAHDATGRAISETLAQKVEQNPNIRIFTDCVATRLLGDASRCWGVECLNEAAGRMVTFLGRATLLATGGASKQYAYTTHSEVVSGDGIAMAWRMGCRIVDLEFQQFHPTCLYHPKAGALLLSEAIRGEGGRLLGMDGKPFMERVDVRGELAPRDIVARTIDHEMKMHGWEHVYLDISHRDKDWIQGRFPMLYQACLALGFDMSKDPLPVVPAAHYTCGGVYVENITGKTDCPGLFAIGEVAATGMHGANRLASNSLLECVVMARAVSEAAQEASEAVELPDTWPAPPTLPALPEEPIFIPHDWREIRQLMWDYVGIVRNERRLKQALSRLEVMRDELASLSKSIMMHRHAIECQHLVEVAWLTVQAALVREESRGLHARSDFPKRNSALDHQHSCLQKDTGHSWLSMAD